MPALRLGGFDDPVLYCALLGRTGSVAPTRSWRRHLMEAPRPDTTGPPVDVDNENPPWPAREVQQPHAPASEADRRHISQLPTRADGLPAGSTKRPNTRHIGGDVRRTIGDSLPTWPNDQTPGRALTAAAAAATPSPRRRARCAKATAGYRASPRALREAGRTEALSDQQWPRHRLGGSRSSQVLGDGGETSGDVAEGGQAEVDSGGLGETAR